MADFREQVVYQVMRLASLPYFPQHPAGVNEIVNWLIEKAPGDLKRVRAVVDEAVEFQEWPGLGDLRNIWLRLFPEVVNRSAANPACRYCAGSGWEVVERKGHSGVERCRCGDLPPSNEAKAYIEPSKDPSPDEQRELTLLVDKIVSLKASSPARATLTIAEVSRLEQELLAWQSPKQQPQENADGE